MVHSVITLYPPGETEFTTNGLGSLSEATSCVVKEEANGSFELEMVYPIWGRRYNDLKNRSIIFCKPNPVDPPQAFRVYQITKPINGLATYYASHISYDLSGYPVSPFSASGCVNALTLLKSHAVVEHPFEFWTDKSTSGNFNLITPASTRSLLGGVEGSILDVYKGDYKFDNFLVRLYEKRGFDRGVVIRYGKNLTDFNQEEKISGMYTAVLPFYYHEDEETGEVLVTGDIVQCDGTYGFDNILVQDFSSDYTESQPTIEQLNERAKQYIKDNKIGEPDVSLTVSFAQLEQTLEYQDLALLERVELFDTVTVEFPEMNVSSKTDVQATEYDVLTNRYNSITLGTIKASIQDTIASQETDLSDQVNQKVDNLKSDLQKAVDNATKWITNGKGYMVAVTDEAGNWTELCSLDTMDIETAINVWRWNNGGFGHSSQGYNGPYTTAITQDGQIVADFITAGILRANLIQAGILSSKDGEAFYLDIENGILKMKATELTITGKTVNEISQEIAESQFNKGIGNFITQTYDPKIADLQNQIDGQIENYFYDYDPALDNVPASNWKTEADYQKHEGDIFYNRSKGYAYRFFKAGNTWKWQLIQDTDITKALDAASAAQDTADGKRRVFTTTPKPPYDVGDLWVQGEHGDILRCQTSKSSSASYSLNDWILASKYTDDSGLTAFIEGDYKNDLDKIKNQADQKAETWYQSTNPANSWTSTERAEHKGDLWYDTSNQKTYIYSGSGWNETKTTPPDDVFDQIDGKIQMFTSTPTPPYHKGDLWFGGTSSDIKVCTYTRTTGYYSSSDWQKRDRYIDSTTATTAATNAANTAVSNKLTQTNIFNALTNNGQNQGIYLQNGRIYINAEYIGSGQISADRIDTSNLVASQVNSVNGSYWCKITYGRVSGGYNNSTENGYLDLTSNVTMNNKPLYPVVLRAYNNMVLWADDDIRLWSQSGKIQIMRSATGVGWLHVAGTVESNYGYGFINYFYIANGPSLGFYDSTGSVHFVNISSSDVRRKRNIEESDIRAIDVINAIGHCSFDYVDDEKEHWDCGYIAQQLEQIRPEFVRSAPNKDEDGNDTDKYSLFVNDFAILGYATKAIQELSEENDALKARCESLEQRVEKLEQLVQTLIH